MVVPHAEETSIVDLQAGHRGARTEDRWLQSSRGPESGRLARHASETCIRPSCRLHAAHKRTAPAFETRLAPRRGAQEILRCRFVDAAYTEGYQHRHRCRVEHRVNPEPSHRQFALLDIVAPQVFAVGISAIREAPVVVTGAPVKRSSPSVPSCRSAWFSITGPSSSASFCRFSSAWTNSFPIPRFCCRSLETPSQPTPIPLLSAAPVHHRSTRHPQKAGTEKQKPPVERPVVRRPSSS